MKVLGISAFFHDSSACLVVDGKVVAGALEERFTRIKHDAAMPIQAIEYCLEEGGITIDDVDEVVFFEKPFTKFERILDNYSKRTPFGFLPFQKAIKVWLKEKMWVEDVFKKTFKFKGDFKYCQHHLSHAANACYQSDFDSAAYLVIDGVGEKSTTSFGTYKDGVLTPIAEQHYPHSLGLLYSAFTQYCGFKVNSGEYKLMGLAPYGKPQYEQLIWDEFLSVSEDGVIELALNKFGFLNDLKMINRKFENVFGVQMRNEGEEMTLFYKDIAASIQKVAEKALLLVANHVFKETGATKLIYSGGVALNCVANSKLVQDTSFDDVFIHSASGDGGCALGAALWMSQKKSKTVIGNNDFIGPNYDENSIVDALNNYNGIKYQKIEPKELFQLIAKELTEDAVVGWFQGKMEFGPRALGNRSILASPIHPEMKSILNLKIKKREGFRPFAPVVLADQFSTYFKRVDNTDYSRMLYVAEGLPKAKEIPSCLHEDNTSRVQSLEKDFNPRLYELLTEFKKETGVPVLINTSFNERGEPVVCTPKDAINCFFNTEMDVLVMQDFVVFKRDNQKVEFKAIQYELD